MNSADALVTPYGRRGPRVLIALSTAERGVFLHPLIDSGATRSMFPLRVAIELGIEQDLVQDTVRAVGVEGAGFATWSYPPGLIAQVMTLRPDGRSRPKPWGAPVQMTPAFASKDVLLLGREDFFLGFEITFEPAGPRFVLAQ